jgi:hypothetical protein
MVVTVLVEWWSELWVLPSKTDNRFRNNWT